MIDNVKVLPNPLEEQHKTDSQRITKYLKELVELSEAGEIWDIALVWEDSEEGVLTYCEGNSPNPFKMLHHIQTDLVDDYVERNIDLGDVYEE